MVVLVELLKTCVPTIVGALIVIIPTAINKRLEMKQKRKEQDFQDKQQRYTRLITLFTKMLRGQKKESCSDADIDELISLINTINITGNAQVVKALNDYVKTWGKVEKDIQNMAYFELVKAIRGDLDNNKLDKDFPQIGLLEIQVERGYKE